MFDQISGHPVPSQIDTQKILNATSLDVVYR
jgi:hypothetical protein